MTRLIVGFLVFLAPVMAGDPQAQVTAEADRVPVLAELFTSEGCSSCPPADRVLEMISRQQPVEGAYVIGMSEHVTYWDHQGWKDPFGSPRFTERQKMYAYRFKLEDIFTPQLVIDGTTQMIGSNTAEIKAALVAAARTPKPRLIVGAVPRDGDMLIASASGPGLEAGAAEGAELLWAITEDDLTIDVQRGENAKRTLRHTGVVRTLTSRKIDPARGAEIMSDPIQLRSDWKRENLRVVAFVQSTKSKRVLSVGWTRLPATP